MHSLTDESIEWEYTLPSTAANEEVGGATASSKVPERGGAKTGGASSSGKQLGVPVRKASPIASSQEPAASSSANGDGGNSGADNKATAKRKSTTGLARKQKEMVVTEDQIEPENRWWDKPDLELSKAAIKWNSLEHHGNSAAIAVTIADVYCRRVCVVAVSDDAD